MALAREMVETSSRRVGSPGRLGAPSPRASSITAPWGRWETCFRERPFSRFAPAAFQAPYTGKIGERVTWSFGVGLGTTGTGSQVILKSRIEFEFGRKHH